MIVPKDMSEKGEAKEFRCHFQCALHTGKRKEEISGWEGELEDGLFQWPKSQEK
jgi:hypothetical protein